MDLYMFKIYSIYRDSLMDNTSIAELTIRYGIPVS